MDGLKHTAGPWAKEGHRNIVNYSSKTIRDIAVVLGEFNSREADANWRLILESPEMHKIVERAAYSGRNNPELARDATAVLNRIDGIKEAKRTCDETKGNYDDNPLLALYDEVMQQCMIREVVGRHIGLSQIETSQMYKGLCPFHQDHKPSFWVNTESQRFECVSCGESGDVVDFMMKYTEMSEKTALLILANEAGIDPEDFLGKQVE